MIRFRASSDYFLQAPLATDERCARYRAVLPDESPVELCVLATSLRDTIAWQPLVKRLALAAMVSHPAVRAVRDVAVEHDPPFVVLEWLTGSRLSMVPQQRPFSREEILQLGVHLSGGLAAAHRFGILHGCVAPENIVGREDGSWTLDISGLAAATPPAANAALFLPPESTPDRRAELPSDIFGLAAVLRWLLDSLGISQAGLPAEWWQLLADGMSPDPDSRPDATQFLSRISKIAESLPGDSRATLVELAQTAVTDRSPADSQAATIDTGLVRRPESTFSLPARIGRFELLEKIGEGGMGAVYRARDIADGTIAAVKVLHARWAGGDARRRFAKEARLLARANNPFLANLLEFNQDDGIDFLAVEFVAGGAVGRFLEQAGQFPESLALAIVADAARGLAVAHQRGIVHRDLKPDNLLLTPAGAEILVASLRDPGAGVVASADGPLVKLSDFGLARTAQQSESLAITRDGSVLGTPLYMSPEQCEGTQVDARSDVYSLGATLFHLLAGRPPFSGDSPVAVIHKHCHEPPPPLQQVRPEISEATARVVEKCLAKNADARYADASELLTDVERLLLGEPTSLRSHPPTPDTRGSQVLEISFACDLASSPAQLWPYVANTDRVNHSLRLSPVRYSTRTSSQRGVERFAETTVAGQRLRWQEHPYEWIEGRRMSVLREFTHGPFNWFINTVELNPTPGGGTRLVQSFRVLPRNWLGRWLGKWELGRKLPRSFRQVYERIDQYLSRAGQQNPSVDAFGRGGSLSAQRRAQLRQRLERLRTRGVEPTVVETLGQFLEHASDLDVARIRPVAFAERFRLPVPEVVNACLLGAREGLLVLLWDILCPSCRIPADVQETLAALKDHSYCAACDLKYEVDFANSVEMIFRAHPELRAVDTQIYCIGGPAFSAHVVAQLRLAAGERFALDLSLEEGIYRLRGPQLPFAVDWRVSPQAVISRWELPLLSPPPREFIPQLRSGSQVITLLNNTSHELNVRLERTAGRSLAFTAADASALALFREMFPEQVLAPGQMVSVTTMTFFNARIHEADQWYEQMGDGPAFAKICGELTYLDEVVRRHGGAVVKTVGEGVLGSFIQPVDAARAALELLSSQAAGRLPLRLSLHRGPAMVTTLNDRLDYFGATLHQAEALLEMAGPSELLLTDRVANQPEVAQLARDHAIAAQLIPTERSFSRELVYRWKINA